MQTNLPHISVVTPVYGCKTCLAELYLRLKSTLEQINPEFEIILVNDASPDGAWETIVELAARDQRVKGINLSRNFGQHYAITAGLDHAQGEWVVVMDCDLQDQPEEIVKLYNKALEGFDVVLAQRIVRHDSWGKRIGSKLFYRILGYLTDTEQDASIANFGIFNTKVIYAIRSMGDYNRYFPTMVRWVGFRTFKLPVQHAIRTAGVSSYSLKKLLRLSLDVILSFSDKPLRLTVKLGFAISVIAFLFAIYNLFLYIHGDIEVAGFTSLIISIWFLSGLVISILGIVGLYIGKTFDKVKQRPVYIVSNQLNM